MNATELAAKLVQAASNASGLSAFQIISRKRTAAICEARWACWAIMRDRGCTFTAIGEVFCRDHTAIMKGVQNAKHPHGKNFAQLCQAVREFADNNL